jgi:HSP20 family protein
MLMRWTPTRDHTGLSSAVDRLIEQLAAGEGDWSRGMIQNFQLPVNVVETKNGYRIEAPIPGFRPEEVEVTFSDGLLTIKAEHREERKNEEGNYLRREMVYGNFFRQLALPSDVRGDDIKADFDDGVLRIEVPKAPKPQPKKISVGKRSGQQSSEHVQVRGDGNAQSEQQSREKTGAKSR